MKLGNWVEFRSDATLLKWIGGRIDSMQESTTGNRVMLQTRPDDDDGVLEESEEDFHSEAPQELSLIHI